MKIITITSQKGGSCKSTTSILIAETLKVYGKVLLMDCDPQGGASSLLNVKGAGMFDLLTGGKVEPIEARGLFVIPANHKLDKIAYTLPPFEIRNIISIFKDYDFIVLDTPPTVQGISRAAVMAADKIIIPADISRTTIEPTLYTLEAIKDSDKIGNVLLIGKEPKPEATGYNADLYREFKQTIIKNYIGTLQKSATAQKAAAGLCNVPKTISELLKEVVL